MHVVCVDLTPRFVNTIARFPRPPRITRNMLIRRRRIARPSSIRISSSSSSSNEPDTPLSFRPQRAPPRLRRHSRLPTTLLVLVLATAGALFHCGHVARLHENHLTFSHLSNTERELTFRSEMAFYYSFYKQVGFSCLA